MHKCVEISGEEAGVHFLMKLKTEKAEENVIELAKARASSCHHFPSSTMKRRQELKTRM